MSAVLDDLTDTITVLTAPSRRLAKRYTSLDTKAQDYDDAKTFNGHTEAVGRLEDIADLLHELAGRSNCCVVRGTLIAGSSARGIRRLLYPDKETGDQPTLRDVPRRWLAIDCDGVERPASLPAHDLLGCAELVLERLPEPFMQAACVVQATASHSVKPGCRLRLWFWLSHPLTGAALKRWVGGIAGIDGSVFGAAQAIYTAAPLFAPGLRDPLPTRFYWMDGLPWVANPTEAELAPPPRPELAQSPPVRREGDTYALAALRSAARNVVTAGEGSRHETCVKETWTLLRLVADGQLSESDVERVMVESLVQAGKSETEGGKIVAWALAHRGKAA